MKFRKIDIKNHLGEIFTGLIVVALFSYLFVGIGIKTSLNEEFWTIFGIGFAIMIAITSIWYPSAKAKAKLKDKNFKNQRLEYSILVDRVVKTNNFKGLRDFCEYATNENRIERINELYRKSQSEEGLTGEEKQEQARLRAEYLTSIRESFRAQLENIEIVD